MKHLKTKLMASAAMLMVATVMISSASFAWFTISTAPEVSGVSTKTATNGALEIALVGTDGFTEAGPGDSNVGDSGMNTTWGNLIDVSAYFADGGKELRPAALNSGATGLECAAFGLDGRVSELTALDSDYEAVSEETGTFRDGAVKVFSYGGEPYAYQFDYYMRTNTEGNIILQQEGADRGAGEDGLGCDVTSDDSNVKVAISVDGGAYQVVYNESTWSSNPIFEADANTLYKVSVLLFWDGTELANADLATSNPVTMNIQFANDTDLAGMGMTGTGNGRHDSGT